MKKLRVAGNKYVSLNFSMVELVLSLVVVMTGIIAVLGMFPAGLKSNQKAIHVGFAADAGEQFLRYNATRVKNNWDWINVFANQKPGNSEPSSYGWADESIFSVGNVRITPNKGFDPGQDSNSGFFLLEQLTENQVDFSAILRVWKDHTTNQDLSENVNMFVEVSWPALCSL